MDVHFGMGFRYSGRSRLRKPVTAMTKKTTASTPRIAICASAAQVCEVFHARDEADKIHSGHLIHESDFAGQVSDIVLDAGHLPKAVKTHDFCGALLGFDKAHQMADGRSFSRAIGSEKTEDFAFFYRKREVEDAVMMAVVLGKMVDFDGIHWYSALSFDFLNRISRMNLANSYCNLLTKIFKPPPVDLELLWLGDGTAYFTKILRIFWLLCL